MHLLLHPNLPTACLSLYKRSIPPLFVPAEGGRHTSMAVNLSRGFCGDKMGMAWPDDEGKEEEEEVEEEEEEEGMVLEEEGE